eukprot:Gb_26814 [translate_table: standard]
MLNARRIFGLRPFRTLEVVDIFFRLLALVATLAAALVMATSNQTLNTPIGRWITANYHYSPAFMFFVVANTIACGYSLLSIVLNSIANVIKWRSFAFTRCILILCDLIMAVLLSSGASAATAIGHVGLKGNSHVGWNEFCSFYVRFCAHVGGAIVSSLIGMCLLRLRLLQFVYRQENINDHRDRHLSYLASRARRLYFS